jgi:demethylmenaquinone methyltransferase/2-methoxy-6-polyprenyl-1,4-benzoquinol methylase
VVFFGFWLSHVPDDRFESFWSMVRSALAPGGRVFFVDSLAPSVPSHLGHAKPLARAMELRRLNDGREFRVVKVFHDPERLQAALIDLGWNARLTPTGRFFLYGSAEPA